MPSPILIFAAQTRVELGLGADDTHYGINMAYLSETSSFDSEICKLVADYRCHQDSEQNCKVQEV